MPAHNEAAFLETAVREVHEGLRARGLEFELLVVENGSTDDTLAIAGRLAEQVSEHSRFLAPCRELRRGVARGPYRHTGRVRRHLRCRLLRARASSIRRWRSSKSGDEAPVIVVASKRAPGSRDERPLPRRFVTAVFGSMLHVGFSLSVSETHGMKAMRRAPVERLLRQCRFASDLFDTELVIRAERAGLRVAELPARTQERRPSRTSIWRRVPRTLVGLIELRVTLSQEARRRDP